MSVSIPNSCVLVFLYLVGVIQFLCSCTQSELSCSCAPVLSLSYIQSELSSPYAPVLSPSYPVLVLLYSVRVIQSLFSCTQSELSSPCAPVLRPSYPVLVLLFSVRVIQFLCSCTQSELSSSCATVLSPSYPVLVLLYSVRDSFLSFFMYGDSRCDYFYLCHIVIIKIF